MAPTYDMLIRGGTVIDPASGLSGRQDVAIRDGVIAAVGPNLTGDAAQTVDATGQIVTAGLIDLHTHVWWGATFWGIEPDPVAARSGATTWLDVGSAGAYSFPGFREFIVERSQTRIYSLLNLSAIGLIAPTWEFSNIDYCDVDLAETMVEHNRDVILGIKARIDSRTTRGVGIRPLAMARELADRVGLPLMVHIGGGPPSLSEVIPLLRPGDILTHCFTGQDMKIVDDAGVPNPAILELRDKGLILDIGHGAGSFSYTSAEAMLAAGILPDVISTDLHQLAVQGPAIDMPTTMSKFLNLGLSLEDVIERSTSRPADAMGKSDLGRIAPGSPADVAIFTLDEGDWVFHDVHMNERRGSQRLHNTLTIVNGAPMERVEERPLHPWAVLNDVQSPYQKPLAYAAKKGHP